MSIRIANRKEELIAFLDEVASSSNFSLKRISLDDQDKWAIKNGAFSHESNGFFQVVGIENVADRKEQHLVLYQPQSALTGLIFHQENDQIFVLMQARVEPGNTGIIQYGPTIQSTPANYLKIHGGKATSYIDYFLSLKIGCDLITHSIQHDLGLKYFQKSKSHHYLVVDEKIETEQNMIWASLSSIYSLIEVDNILNADLRSLLSVFNWSLYFGNEKFNVNHNITDLIPSTESNKYKFIPLDHLEDWVCTSNGVFQKSGDSISIQMFQFSCLSREVSSWSQPLYCLDQMDLIQLVFVNTNKGIEFLLKFGSEYGVSSPLIVYPSYFENLNGNSEISSKAYSGELIKEFIQCDEGGRFFKNDNKYQLIEVSSKFLPFNNQKWVSREQLIWYLGNSNLCSFQLRCACSMALDLLHPDFFKN